jgi:ketosteroid isomerase-like protein
LVVFLFTLALRLAKMSLVLSQPIMTPLEQVESDIRAIVDRETLAWNSCDAEALVDLFHPDTVWPWPPDANSHDPKTWVMPLGRFNRTRWKDSWDTLFKSHLLIHNFRQTVRVQVSDELDGAFAVVDIDTLWQNRTTGETQHWSGRACKVYTKMNDRWYFIYQTGLLNYAIRT